MPRPFKILLILLVFLLIVGLAVAGVVAYALSHSRDLLIVQIDKHLGVKASAAEVRYIFPSSLLVRDLRFGDQLAFGRLLVTPSLTGFFLKRAVVFNEILITSPRVRVVRRSDGTMDMGLALPAGPAGGPSKEAPSKDAASPSPSSEGPLPPPSREEPLPSVSKQEPSPSASARGKSERPPVYVEHLKILDGQVTFVDEALGGDPPFRVEATDVRLEVRRVSLLEPGRMNVDVSALVGPLEGAAPAPLTGSGEFDLWTRKGTLRLDVTAVPLTLFGPYYVTYLKKKVLTGTATLGADFRVEGDDLAGDCRVSLDGMGFQEPEAQGAAVDLSSVRQQAASSGDLQYTVFPLLLSAMGQASFEFSFKTRLDRPRFENVKIKGMFLQPRTLAPLAVEASGGSVEGFKKIGKEFEAIGKEFKKVFDY